LRLIAAVFKAASIVKFDAVKGVDRDEFKIVVWISLSGAEQLGEHKGRCDNGGATVELESILLVEISAAAELIARFE
jgi:hypothetical protein